jgi:Zn ribbon nucleic-acid-binding protein
MSKSASIVAANCPACGHHVAVEFFDGGNQPLATLSWPASRQAALALKQLPLTFVRCVECGHIYNTGFDYAEVPYVDKPNLMFNSGEHW